MRHPWVLGARPRTLPASVVPVMVGTGAAAAYGDVVWWRAVLAGVVALSLQVGVNYANDYSDGSARHRRRTGRAAAAGRLGPGQPRRRQEGGGGGISPWPEGPAWPWPPWPAGGWSVWAPPA